MAEYRIFDESYDPPDASVSDGVPLTLAVEISTTAPLWLIAIGVWRPDLAMAGPLRGAAYRVQPDGPDELLPAADTVFALDGTGWQWSYPAAPPLLDHTRRHHVATRTPAPFAFTGGFWSFGAGLGGITRGPLTAHSSVFGLGDHWPDQSGNGANYWVDLIVSDTEPGEPEQPAEPGLLVDATAHDPRARWTAGVGRPSMSAGGPAARWRAGRPMERVSP